MNFSPSGQDPVLWVSAHSYFNISDIQNIKIHGLENASYRDMLDHTDHIQQGSINFNGETDRTYYDTDTSVRIEDPGLKRTINISKRGSRTTVVWNPWIDKAARMQDFGVQEYRNMVCVEAANADADFREILPGESHEPATAIRVEQN